MAGDAIAAGFLWRFQYLSVPLRLFRFI
jgi:hypothetical protein